MVDMSDAPVKRRRWFRFSLRALLVVMTVLCVWLGFKVNAARRQREAVAAILKAGGTVAYDYQLVTQSNGKKVIDATASLTVPVWLRSLFGDDFFCSPVSVVMSRCVIDESHFLQLGNLETVTSVKLTSVRIISSKDGLRRSVQDSDLAALGKMTQLQSLELRNAKIEGFGFAPLANSRHLRTVTFTDNNVYPTPLEVLERFGKINSLEHLSLDGCSIDDAELSKLRNLSNLKELWLNFTDISDAGLKHLAGFTKLTHLYVNGDDVTAEGIRDLKKSLPNCQVYGPRFE